jgi:tripartite-type tricarboxylate transporter receptor subunit TctC
VPAPVIAKLSSSLKTALASPAVRERFAGMGVEIIELGQAEFAAYVRADYEKWLKVAREGNIVVE